MRRRRVDSGFVAQRADHPRFGARYLAVVVAAFPSAVAVTRRGQLSVFPLEC